MKKLTDGFFNRSSEWFPATILYSDFPKKVAVKKSIPATGKILISFALFETGLKPDY